MNIRKGDIVEQKGFNGIHARVVKFWFRYRKKRTDAIVFYGGRRAVLPVHALRVIRRAA